MTLRDIEREWSAELDLSVSLSSKELLLRVWDSSLTQ